MKNEFLLISDGSSDKALIPFIKNLLFETTKLHYSGIRIDFGKLRNPPKTLVEKIYTAIDLFPDVELIFIHRDAENQTIQSRIIEIDEHIEPVINQISITYDFLKIIPIRMTEAWLLTDENAIKKAAGNPNSKEKLNLPPLNHLERIPDPKETLINLIKKASGLSRRRLSSLNIRQCIGLIPEYLNDYSLHQKLAAYSFLQQEIRDYWQKQ